MINVSSISYNVRVKYSILIRALQESLNIPGESYNMFRMETYIVLKLAKEIVRPPDFKFTKNLSKIKDDSRLWPYLEGCIGVIYGTHILVIVPTKV